MSNKSMHDPLSEKRRILSIISAHNHTIGTASDKKLKMI